MIDTSVNDRILFFLVFPASHYLFFVNYDYLTDALAVGTSIGVGGIVASSYTLVTKEEPLFPPFSSYTPHRFTISIFYSLVLGLVAGLFIWGVYWSWKKRS